MSTISEERLTPEQKELVAIGASVGAGCLPCASFHFEFSRKLKIEAGRMLSAAVEAERVVSDARARLSTHVREELGAETKPAETSELDRELAALGAAIAANSIPNIRRHMLKASECGLSGAQLAAAIGVAERVQNKAAEGHIKETGRFLEHFDAKLADADADTDTDTTDDLCGADCGCNRKETSDVL
jgi:AhpD family alkylhydroperoxidase